MLGQNTGFYAARTAFTRAYAGVAANTRCSKRDLPMEIADALAAKGMGLYSISLKTSAGGIRKAANAFGLTAQGREQLGGGREPSLPSGTRSIKTWADRYGSRVRGWFFDGYEARWGVTAAMANTYSATCKAANPCAVVTFNGTDSDRLAIRSAARLQSIARPGCPRKDSDLALGSERIAGDVGLPAAGGLGPGDRRQFAGHLHQRQSQEVRNRGRIKAQAVFALGSVERRCQGRSPSQSTTSSWRSNSRRSEIGQG